MIDTEMSNIITYGIGAFLGQLGFLFMLCLCIFYIVKVGPKTEAVLLLLGQLFFLPGSILQVLTLFLLRYIDTETYATISYVTAGCSAIGSILFAIGFYLIIRKLITYYTT